MEKNDISASPAWISFLKYLEERKWEPTVSNYSPPTTQTPSSMDIQCFSTQGSLENSRFNDCHRANTSFLFPLSYCENISVETNQAIRDWHINKLKSEKTEKKTQVCVSSPSLSNTGDAWVARGLRPTWGRIGTSCWSWTSTSHQQSS